MPVIKISLTDEAYQELTNMAQAEGISIQDLIRNKVFGESTTLFTPADAVKRVYAKYKVGDRFTIPELYGEDWATMKRGVAGVFGKQFYNYVLDNYKGKIDFVGMVNRNRHAQYEVKSELD